MRPPPPQGSPAGLSGRVERFPRQRRHRDRGPPRCRSGGPGPEGDPTPRHPCPCPGARSQPSGPARGFKGPLKKSEFRRSVEGDPGEWAGRGGAEARTQKAEGESGHQISWLTRPPRGWPLLPPGLRLSGASSLPPQPRGPPLPGPSAPFILLDSAWGFAGFWEIKTASNSGGAMPGQTGPGGPCAPGYRPRAPCSGG